MNEHKKKRAGEDLERKMFSEQNIFPRSYRRMEKASHCNGNFHTINMTNNEII